MMCTKAVHEIVVECNFGFQILDTLPQFVFVAGEKNRVYQSEESLRHLVAIGAEENSIVMYIVYFIRELISKQKLR